MDMRGVGDETSKDRRRVSEVRTGERGKPQQRANHGHVCGLPRLHVGALLGPLGRALVSRELVLGGTRQHRHSRRRKLGVIITVPFAVRIEDLISRGDGGGGNKRGHIIHDAPFHIAVVEVGVVDVVPRDSRRRELAESSVAPDGAL